MTRNKANGFAIGKKEDGTPYSWPESGYGNLAVIGGPGSGKTRTIIANKLLAALQAGESVLCFDPKQEMEKLFANAFLDNGYEVRTTADGIWFQDKRFSWYQDERCSWLEKNAEKKRAFFFGDESKSKTNALLTSLFGSVCSQFYFQNTNGVPIHCLHFIFDELQTYEFTVANDLATRMNFVREKEINNVDFTISIQSKEQLKTTCGAKLCRKILYDLCDAQIFLGQGKHGEQLPGNKQALLWMPDSDDILLNLYDYLENPVGARL